MRTLEVEPGKLRPLPASLQISDRKAAAVLTNARARSILFTLMRQPGSLKKLHDLLGLSLSLLHYHVGRLCRYGYLRIVRTEKRAGRPVAIYGATARSFLAPAELVDQRGAGGLQAQLREAFERNRAHAPAAWIAYELSENGSPRMRRIAAQRPARTCAEGWIKLKLSEKQAAELAQEMQRLIARYQSGCSSRCRPHLLYWGFAQTWPDT